VILLISASWVARITGVSHRCQAMCLYRLQFNKQTSKCKDFFFWWVCGVLHLQSRHSTVWVALPAHITLVIYLFILLVLGFELRASYLIYCPSHSANPFLCWYFWDRVSKTICPGWLQTMILLISASWIARLQAWVASTCFCRWRLVNYLCGLALNHDPPNLSLPSS
jgi:hypothetical protein